MSLSEVLMDPRLPVQIAGLDAYLGAGHALMRGFYRHNGARVNILQLVHMPDCSISSASRPGVRQYFYVERHNLKKAYQILISPLEDKTFHFYDPDGNRINVFS